MIPKLMIRWAITAFFLFLIAPAGLADIAEQDLPDDVQWYGHADLKAMESSVTGRYILDFLDDEVFEELEEDTGITLREDLQAVSVFGGAGEQDGVIVLYGDISAKNRTKIQAVMELRGEYTKDTRKGVEIFTLEKRKRKGDKFDADSDEMFDEDETTYIAFGKRKQTLVTQNKARLDAFVKAGGELEPRKKVENPGSLLVLKADKSMVKAGMNANAGIAEKGDWDSNILQHMKQIALVLSDKEGKAAVEAQLVTGNEQLAESIKNIVQGLISIKSLDRDEKPEILEMLRSIKLDLSGATIRASILLDPDMLKEVID